MDRWSCEIEASFSCLVGLVKSLTKIYQVGLGYKRNLGGTFVLLDCHSLLLLVLPFLLR